MRTPAGQECRFYYENFHRGRSDQECRLLDANPKNKLAWHPSDCGKCPVPAILQANSSPDLVLEAKINKGILNLFGRKVEVRAFCSKHLIDVAEPRVGCPECAKEKPGLSDLFKL
jgi:hypothetical protein